MVAVPSRVKRRPPALRRASAGSALLGIIGIVALLEARSLSGEARSSSLRFVGLVPSGGVDGEANDGVSGDRSLGGSFLGQTILLAEYLLESGYLWPLLGFVFACLLLARWRGHPRPYSSMQVAYDSVQHQQPLPTPAQQVACDYQAPAGYALVPVDGMQYGFHPPTGQLAPIWEQDDGSQSGDQDKDDLQPQDFKALLDRTQQDEALSEGIARVRQAFLGQRDPIARGCMTVRKVLELERVLIQELEESYSQKVGFIASCFHRWRCEAMCLRVGRRYEEDFSMQKGEWERYLLSHEKTFEQKVLDAARKVSENQARNHQVAALLLDKWAHGDNVALKRSTLASWKHWANRLHTLRVQKRQVTMVVQLWVEGGIRGSMHFCLKSWRQLTRETREAEDRRHEMEAAKRSWDKFFDQEQAKLQKKMDDNMKDIQARQARAERDVELALASWERGMRTGLVTVVVQTWGHHAKKMQRLRRQKQAVHQVVLEVCAGQADGLIKGCFINWRSCAAHEVYLVQEKKKWEALLAGEQERWEKEDNEWESSQARKKAAAHQLVDMTLQKWEHGDNLGLLLKVYSSWQHWASKLASSKRRREAVHSCTLRWLEGTSGSDVRTCFLHWRVLAEQTRTSLKQEQERLEKRKKWEEMLADETKRHEADMHQLDSSTQLNLKKAHAVVDLAVKSWELGDGAGLVLEVLSVWSVLVREAKQLARQRQAVHMTLLKSFEGSQQGILQTCFLNWKLWARHAVTASFGEKRLSEEKKRWEQFLENEDKAHAEGLQRLQEEKTGVWKHAEEALGALLFKWNKSEAANIIFVSFLGWRQLSAATATLNCGKQMVHLAVLRFFEGDSWGAAHGLFLNWKHWAKVEVLHKTEVAMRKKTIAGLEARAEQLISSQESRLLKYAHMLGSSCDPAYLTAILAGWRMHSQGIKSAEAHRQLEVALQEQQRLHHLASTRRKQLSVASLHVLGVKDEATVALDCFLAWSRQWQEAKQEWAHQLARNELIKKYSWYIQCMANKEADESLLAACFWELQREAKQIRHTREREEREQQQTQLNFEMEALEVERNDIEDQLKMAYKQIDSVTETLQKELRTKEDLATELREAYDKLRQLSTRRPPKPITHATTVSPGERELPHLPASVLGAPGGQGVDLRHSLVGRQQTEESAHTPSSAASGRSQEKRGSNVANWANTASRLFN